MSPAGPYSIGSDVWNGLSKVMEEANEVGQVGAKIIGCGGQQIHFDGSNLTDRMVEELGDLLAAIHFFRAANALSHAAVVDRMKMKLALFRQWDAENRAKPVKQTP